MREKIFDDDAFVKHIGIGDELKFAKNKFSKLRIDLTWAGTDLDLCAFLLDEDMLINERGDLVYYNSQIRWKTKREFCDPDFDPLDGEMSRWPNSDYSNKRRWMDETLPLSGDGSVIGSWDDMAEDEDDLSLKQETLHILLRDVDTKRYDYIVLAAAVAPDRIAAGETFADANNPKATIYDAEKKEIIAEYQLDIVAPGKDAVCFGKMRFDQDNAIWSFLPMADGYKGGMEYLAREVFN